MHSEEDVSSSEEDVSNLEKKLIRTKIMTKQDWNPRPFPMVSHIPAFVHELQHSTHIHTHIHTFSFPPIPDLTTLASPIF